MSHPVFKGPLQRLSTKLGNRHPRWFWRPAKIAAEITCGLFGQEDIMEDGTLHPTRVSQNVEIQALTAGVVASLGLYGLGRVNELCHNALFYVAGGALITAGTATLNDSIGVYEEKREKGASRFLAGTMASKKAVRGLLEYYGALLFVTKFSF